MNSWALFSRNSELVRCCFNIALVFVDFLQISSLVKIKVLVKIYKYIEMSSSLHFKIFSGLASQIRGVESKISFFSLSLICPDNRNHRC